MNRALRASSDFKSSLKSDGIRIVGIHDLPGQFQRRQPLFHRPSLPVVPRVRVVTTEIAVRSGGIAAGAFIDLSSAR